jgi:tripartite-type tricarboxylate transporter receptor subunit TctC
MERRAIMFTQALLITLSVVFLASVSFAGDQFPSKPVNIYVGFPPGGVAGNSARAIATPAAEFLGEPTVIMHKPGAGGTLAVDYISSQKPDGYNLRASAKNK